MVFRCVCTCTCVQYTVEFVSIVGGLFPEVQRKEIFYVVYSLVSTDLRRNRFVCLLVYICESYTILLVA